MYEHLAADQEQVRRDVQQVEVDEQLYAAAGGSPRDVDELLQRLGVRLRNQTGDTNSNPQE